MCQLRKVSSGGLLVDRGLMFVSRGLTWRGVHHEDVNKVE